jgi:hypothetical protein
MKEVVASGLLAAVFAAIHQVMRLRPDWRNPMDVGVRGGSLVAAICCSILFLVNVVRLIP